MLGDQPYLFTGDLTKVTWSRATNTKPQISKAIYDSKIIMIEVDIGMGKIVGSTESKLKPIVAYPPEVTSELSVEEFLKMIVPMIEDLPTPKGFKLDFKGKDAFALTLPHLKKVFTTRKKRFPIWLNADIFPGPGARDHKPIDGAYFLKEAAKFPEIVISVGWMTKTPSDESGYTTLDIDAMLSLLQRHKLKQPVTIPIRAMMLPHCYSDIIRLIKNTDPKTTLTVWCYPSDRPDVRALADLLKEVGTQRIYLDIHQAILDSLRSPSPSN